MNKAMKQNLETVIKGLVNDDSKAASDALHEYLRAKAQSLLLGEDSMEGSAEEGSAEEGSAEEVADEGSAEEGSAEEGSAEEGSNEDMKAAEKC
jgi:hypothetical protein